MIFTVWFIYDRINKLTLKDSTIWLDVMDPAIFLALNTVLGT